MIPAGSSLPLIFDPQSLCYLVISPGSGYSKHLVMVKEIIIPRKVLTPALLTGYRVADSSNKSLDNREIYENG